MNSEAIYSRISKLRDYLKILKERTHENKDDFRSNYKIYALAERYLQLFIECILDIFCYKLKVVPTTANVVFKGICCIDSAINLNPVQ